MAKKLVEAPVVDSITEDDRRSILRTIYDKVELEPPLGERYEYLLREIIRSAITDNGLHLTREYRDTLVEDLFSYVASYGPIEQYFDDPQISEIMVNGPDQIFIEKNGKMILTDTKFENKEQVRFAINHMINPRGRFVNTRHALIDSRLPDGSRLNAVIMPVAPDWPCITIRRFLKDKLTVQQLVELGSITPQIADFLEVGS